MTIAWDPPVQGATIAGYKVFYGTSPGSYQWQVDVGDVTSYSVGNLTGGQTYYFALRSYTADGSLSALSTEVSKTVPVATVTSLTLTSSVASPVTAGSPVTLTASASGGTQPYQYQWSVHDGAAWSVGSWTSASTMNWTPSAAGSYTTRVGIRSSGNTSNAPELTQSLPFSVTAPATPIAVTLVSDLNSPQRIQSTVLWSASATGGIAPYQYKWSLYDGTRWTDVTGWSSSSTWSWQPTSHGAFQVRVSVRGSDPANEATATAPFRIKPGGK